MLNFKLKNDIEILGLKKGEDMIEIIARIDGIVAVKKAHYIEGLEFYNYSSDSLYFIRYSNVDYADTKVFKGKIVYRLKKDSHIFKAGDLVVALQYGETKSDCIKAKNFSSGVELSKYEGPELMFKIENLSIDDVEEVEKTKLNNGDRVKYRFMQDVDSNIKYDDVLVVIEAEETEDDLYIVVDEKAYKEGFNDMLDYEFMSQSKCVSIIEVEKL